MKEFDDDAAGFILVFLAGVIGGFIFAPFLSWFNWATGKLNSAPVIVGQVPAAAAGAPNQSAQPTVVAGAGTLTLPPVTNVQPPPIQMLDGPGGGMLSGYSDASHF